MVCAAQLTTAQERVKASLLEASADHSGDEAARRLRAEQLSGVFADSVTAYKAVSSRTEALLADVTPQLQASTSAAGTDAADSKSVSQTLADGFLNELQSLLRQQRKGCADAYMMLAQV